MPGRAVRALAVCAFVGDLRVDRGGHDAAGRRAQPRDPRPSTRPRKPAGCGGRTAIRSSSGLAEPARKLKPGDAVLAVCAPDYDANWFLTMAEYGLPRQAVVDSRAANALGRVFPTRRGENELRDPHPSALRRDRRSMALAEVFVGGGAAVLVGRSALPKGRGLAAPRAGRRLRARARRSSFLWPLPGASPACPGAPSRCRCWRSPSRFSVRLADSAAAPSAASPSLPEPSGWYRPRRPRASRRLLCRGRLEVAARAALVVGPLRGLGHARRAGSSSTARSTSSS